MWSCAAIGGVGGVVDYSTGHSIVRTSRALYVFGKIAYTYKFTTPETAEAYHTMNRQSAEMVLDTCRKNEGLYIKFGQALNAMSHALPKEVTSVLRVLLDSAPPVPLDDIRRIFREETGKTIEEVFERFDDVPVACASIAQVHHAWLRQPNGQPPVEVAVKVQKPSIAKQSVWDLRTWQFMNWMISQLFGVPVGWARRTVVDGLKREMDFNYEATSQQRMRENFASYRYVYVPEIYSAYTTRRLMVMEWIEGLKLVEVERVREQFDEKKVLITVFDAFGDMVFKHGFVHGDTHAANVLVRPAPPSPSPGEGALAAAAVTRNVSSKAPAGLPAPWWRRWFGWGRKKEDFQVVFIDFGLSIPVTERFRMEYALVFRSLVTHDMDSLVKTVSGWGFGDGKLFANLQMQMQQGAGHPQFTTEEEERGMTKEEVKQMQREGRDRFRTVTINEERIPREIPIVGRSMELLRSINRLYDSPVDRVSMFVKSAVDALGPLHDYEGVQVYLARMETKMKARQSATEAVSAHDKHTAHSTKVTVSAFDADAERLRQDQAAAVRELNEERNRFFTSRVAYAAERTYRQIVFRVVMLNLKLSANLTRWYNGLLRMFASPEVAERMRVDTLDDRLGRMTSEG